MRAAREIADDIEYLLNPERQVLLDVPFLTLVQSGLKMACRRMIKNKDYLTEYISEARKKGNINNHDCLFALLVEEHKGKISSNNISGISVGMIIAGTLTTTPTIYLALRVMVHFPEVQKKIVKMIKRAVANGRLPGLDDKPNLPYSHATMLEIFRYFTPSPLPGPRYTIRECSYKGYLIPKDCVVHHDKAFWDKPYTFDPTRFLDSEGNLLTPDDERRQRLLTFGTGKRSCLGDNLARVRVFLFMTTILQNFDLKEDPAFPCSSHDPRTYPLSFITTPPSYKVRFVPRH